MQWLRHCMQLQGNANVLRCECCQDGSCSFMCLLCHLPTQSALCGELSANQQGARIVLPMVTNLHMDGGTVLCML